jgi:excisionase family DNA binding protein
MVTDTTTAAEPLIRIGQLSLLTGLPVRYLRRMANEGLLPVYRVGEGRHRRFPIEKAVRRTREVMTSGSPAG